MGFICFTSLTRPSQLIQIFTPLSFLMQDLSSPLPTMSSMFCSCSAGLWIHCLQAGKAPVLGWQMGQTANQAVASQPEWYFNKHREVTEREASHWNDWQFCFQPESTNRWFLASVQKKKITETRSRKSHSLLTYPSFLRVKEVFSLWLLSR